MYELDKEQKEKVLRALRAPVTLEHAACYAGLKVKVLEEYMDEINNSDSMVLTGFGGDMYRAMAEGMLTFMEELKESQTAQLKNAYYETAKSTLEDIKKYMSADKIRQFRESLKDGS